MTLHPPPLLLPLLPLPPLLLLLLLLLLLELLLELLLLLLPLLLPLEATVLSLPPSLAGGDPESSLGKPMVFACPALQAAAVAARAKAQAPSVLRGAEFMIALPIPRGLRKLKPTLSTLVVPLK
jgi:hypothetical protein